MEDKGFLTVARNTREVIFTQIQGALAKSDITDPRDRRLFVSSVLNGIDSDFGILNQHEQNADWRKNPEKLEQLQKNGGPMEAGRIGNRY